VPSKKISAQINVWTPEYYRHLYDQILKEIKDLEELEIIFSIPKWKKDTLLLLLSKSKEAIISKKELRKQVDKDTQKVEYSERLARKATS
jgi:hypothetical protein